ncbi:hypothetical protein BWI17_14805 [Betaproteobacteria bacterium GR16-43]|nr:hypothetical protein BWI17_14805 [Betaproteobacteria bacterium GR16-43]
MSLSTRLLLVILTGLAVAHAAAVAYFTFDRVRTVQRLQAYELGVRIAEVLRSSDRAAAASGEGEHRRLFQRPPDSPFGPGIRGEGPAFGSGGGPNFGKLGGPGFGPGGGPRFATRRLRMPLGWREVASPDPPRLDAPEAPGVVESEIRRTLTEAMGSDPVASVGMREEPARARPGPEPDVMAFVSGPEDSGPRMPPEVHRIQVVLKLADGRYGIAESHVIQGQQRMPAEIWANVALIFLVTTAFSIWAARLAVKPVRTLAQAADRLSRNIDEPPLAEAGATEIRDAARAFNRMQDRLRRHVRNRTLAFAAMSHDIRTPLTRMRLRLENLDAPGQREKFSADLDEIETLARSALEVTRGLSADEGAALIDFDELVHRVVLDHSTGEHAIIVSGHCAPLMGRPLGLARALANLVDNAVKYGRDVTVDLADSPAQARIVVQDRGPGIPPDELAKVVNPYYRVEGSRSRDTGGMGLGLAIAKDIIESHGGDLVLANRGGGGLSVTVTLPRPQS